MTDRDWNELRNEFHQTTDAMIKRSGRSIIAVFDCEGDDQPFAYIRSETTSRACRSCWSLEGGVMKLLGSSTACRK
jgi:hypothetical protein